MLDWSFWVQLFLRTYLPKIRISFPFGQDNDKMYVDSFLWILTDLPYSKHLER